MKLQLIISTLLIFSLANGMDQQPSSPCRLALQQATMETSSKLTDNRTQARKQLLASHTRTTHTASEQEQLDREARIISRIGSAVFVCSAAVAAYAFIAATTSS